MRMQYKLEVGGYTPYVGVVIANNVERDDFY